MPAPWPFARTSGVQIAPHVAVERRCAWHDDGAKPLSERVFGSGMKVALKNTRKPERPP